MGRELTVYHQTVPAEVGPVVPLVRSGASRAGDPGWEWDGRVYVRVSYRDELDVYTQYKNGFREIGISHPTLEEVLRSKHYLARPERYRFETEAQHVAHMMALPADLRPRSLAAPAGDLPVPVLDQQTPGGRQRARLRAAVRTEARRLLGK